ncbi:MAG: FlgD immunoglobulin-like domain containing protein [Candidatus Kapaibacterium sp.]|jgi:hypothetical protein|nr:FlgD immunoglobulin-like domain containing protein [Candidatus Kapabacteria bacterium]
MKKSLTSLMVSGVLVVLLSVGSYAQNTQLVKSVIGTGGVVGAAITVNNTNYFVNGITGQSVIETQSDQTPGSGSYDLNQGFWIPDDNLGVSVEDEPFAGQNGIFNYPNPVTNSTTIEYNLDNPAYVTLKVYDMAGNEIKVVQEGYQSAGSQRVEWNVKNESGVDVSAGSYLYELQVRSAAIAGSGSFDSYSLRNVMVVVK